MISYFEKTEIKLGSKKDFISVERHVTCYSCISTAMLLIEGSFKDVCLRGRVNLGTIIHSKDNNNGDSNTLLLDKAQNKCSFIISVASVICWIYIW